MISKYKTKQNFLISFIFSISITSFFFLGWFIAQLSSNENKSLNQNYLPKQITNYPQDLPSTPSTSSSNVQIQKKENITPKKPVVTQTPKDNYKLEPCDGQEEGCYKIENAPSETMSSSEELNTAVNNYRKTHNLNQLQIDPQICSIATQRANEVQNDFSHSGFQNHANNGDYDFLGFQQIAENLWQGSFSAVHIVEFGWDKSDGHRANLQGDWSRGCAEVFQNNAVFIFVK